MENFSFLDNLLASPSPRKSMLMSAPILDPLAEQARKVGTDPFKAPTFSNLAKIREAALSAYKPSVPETTGGTTGVTTGGVGTGGGTGDSSSDDSGQRELTKAQVMEGMLGTSSGEIEKDARNAVENLKLLEDLKLVVPIQLYIPLKMYFEGKRDAYTYESGNSFRFNDKDEIEKYSDDETVRMQDVAIFGGYYDKDGKFIVVDKAKAELSQPRTDISGLKSASDTASGSQYQEGTVVLDGQGEVVRSGDGSPVLTGKGAAMMRNGIPITMPTTSTNTSDATQPPAPVTVIDTSTASPVVEGGAPVVSSSNGMLTGVTTTPVSNPSSQPVTPIAPITSTSPVVTTPLQPVTPLAPIYSSGGGDSGGGYGSGGQDGRGGQNDSALTGYTE